MVRPRKGPKRPTAVPFHRIKVNSMFVHEGVKYMKYAPKKGITPEGHRIELPDNAMVMPSS